MAVIFEGELNDLMDCTISDALVPPREKKLTRKKAVHKELWKQNIRKKLRVEGKEYVDIQGNVHRARKISSMCNKTCKRECMLNFPEDGRKAIFEAYWKLSD